MSILYCKLCDIFTLKQNCPNCKKITISTKPVKFSPEDRLGKYRRITKLKEA